MRIKPKGDVPNIPDSLFNDNKFLISELDELDIDATLVYKDHYYFLMNNEYLVTNLPRNITVSRLQTYINHLLEDERDETVYEFTPLVKETPQYSLSDLKTIKVQDPEVVITEEETSETTSLPAWSIMNL
ncbi:hypothetical protein EJ377_17405 [Chryseobacterium arthrosphaerae]|uniref:Uncharacterized protein n=1 Tax=Chryseobacterium arthrosphaerae TaxID=651561 RepID=A0A432DTE9_9FLAO|nr:hypothetical protein EJ377_17405 [Chryseobacterium arthrosphaerae]